MSSIPRLSLIGDAPHSLVACISELVMPSHSLRVMFLIMPRCGVFHFTRRV